MQDGLFEFVLEADNSFRINLIKSLENLNLYGRLNDSTRTVNWVRAELKEIANLICSFASFKPDETYTYESDWSYEIGLSLYKFDRENALHTKRGQLKALDALYPYNTYDMYEWFSTSPVQLCLQVTGINHGKMFIKQQSNLPYSVARLNVAIYENVEGLNHEIGQLVNQVNATFNVNPYSYESNQTVCMAYSLTGKKWDSELCVTELVVERLQIKCSCNSINAETIGVFVDTKRVLGKRIEFPEPQKIAQGGNGRVYEIIDEDFSDAVHVKYEQSPIWIMQSVATAIICITGMLITMKLDKND